MQSSRFVYPSSFLSGSFLSLLLYCLLSLIVLWHPTFSHHSSISSTYQRIQHLASPSAGIQCLTHLGQQAVFS
ncbi:hypothetical protein BD560DRAFT_396098 [Blakeslea trispora]|nr:hypothetical protein BD560DRAFT_396098 [Blakeslea trispora]